MGDKLGCEGRADKVTVDVTHHDRRPYHDKEHEVLL
jgi:hypothetical protein